MAQKRNWLPIDERLVPDIFSFKYPKSIWVRGLLFMEMLFAILAVVGTLVLVLLPKTVSTPQEINATTSVSSPQAK